MNETCTCGCCEGTGKITPQRIANRPGLKALAYRAGTHATFLETMLARLSEFFLEIPASDFEAKQSLYPLQALKTREADDAAIALMDCWATAADVLTFYQERIANEGFLGTALERRSILELGRLIGYKLRPGVAASVYLAFEIEKDQITVIPLGVRAQSIPGPGEMPQAFETSELLEARFVWNELKPRLTRPQNITLTNIDTIDTIYLKGTATNLKPDDALLLVFGEGNNQQILRKIEKVEQQHEQDRTKVVFQASKTTGDKPKEPDPKLKPLLEQLLKSPSVQPPNRQRLQRSINQNFADKKDIIPQLLTNLEPSLRSTLYAALRNQEVVKPLEVKIYALRVRAAPFGHNAPLRPEKFDDRANMVIFNEWLIDDPLNNQKTIFSRFNFSVNPPDGRIPATVTFTNLSSGVISDYYWNFGDGSVSDEFSPIHVYSSIGNFKVTLTVCGPAGQDSFISEIRITDKEPIANFTAAPTEGNVPLTVTFTNQSTGVIRAYFWSFGDGSFSKEPNPPQHVYNSAGTFTVTLTVFGPAGLGYNSLTIKVNSVGLAVSRIEATTIRSATLPPPEYHQQSVIFLDAEYDIQPNSWVAIKKANSDIPLFIKLAEHSVAHRSFVSYGLNGKTTRLDLGGVIWIGNPTNEPFSTVRNTIVYAKSEELELSEEPITSPIGADESKPDAGLQIELDNLYDGLESGRWLVVTGERMDVSDTSGVKSSEVVMLAGVEQTFDKDLPNDKTHSMLIFANGLAYKYKRDTVTINANVVNATHGETKAQVLGSGDGTQAFQEFKLSNAPLTYISAVTPSGIENTLQVRVNDLRWRESDNLSDLEAASRSYITRQDNEGNTFVIFGNGERGARLPTGVENVKAVYRSGIGKAGNVAAEQITLLATRPLGVKGVRNPQAATGGADPEDANSGRRNATVALKALDRAVSVEDYADFANAFAGIGKASAVRFSDGTRELVHLTIAGDGDIPISKNSDLYRNLQKALFDFGDPRQPLEIGIRELLLIVASARVQLLPDYLWEKVEPRIRAALLEAFSFDNREFGQPVLRSELISVIEAIEGVDYVDVDRFDALSQQRIVDNLENLNKTIGEEIDDRVVVDLASVDLSNASGPIFKPAQIAYLSSAVPDTLILTEITE